VKKATAVPTFLLITWGERGEGEREEGVGKVKREEREGV